MMRHQMYRKNIFLTLFLSMTLTLGGCDLLANLSGSGDIDDEDTFLDDEFSEEFDDGAAIREPFLFLVPRTIATMPWFLAAQGDENYFSQYNETYGANIEFQEASRQDIMEQFASNEASAAVMTNVDAVATIIGQGIPADIILVCGYSQGDSAILVSSSGADGNLVGKKIAVEESSAEHYLLDRFLLKNLIEFDSVTIENIQPNEAITALARDDIDAVVASDPYAATLVDEQNAQVIFDSREVPKEISDLLVVERSKIENDLASIRALYAIWIVVMEQLLDDQARMGALNLLSEISGIEREEFERQFDKIVFTDTEDKVFSTLRDRKLQKTMRYVRFFMQQHGLAPSDTMLGKWYSLPGRAPVALHFNASPAQQHFRN